MIDIITESQFLDTIKSSNQISIVYLGREGCGGCGKFLPIMVDYVKDHIFDNHPIPVSYYYLNTAQNFIRPYIGAKNVPTTGVPSLIIYYNGSVHATHTGVIDAEGIFKFCNENINKISEISTS